MLKFLDFIKDRQPKKYITKVKVDNKTVILPKSIINSNIFIPTNWPNISQLDNLNKEPNLGIY
jgi:hypothetical protein